MRIFNAFYYSFSPWVARGIASSPALATAARTLLYPLIQILKVSSSIFSVSAKNPELGVVAAGATASALLGLIYVGLPVMGMKHVIRRKGSLERAVKRLQRQ
jgi:hypothetical protein